VFHPLLLHPLAAFAEFAATTANRFPYDTPLSEEGVSVNKWEQPLSRRGSPLSLWVIYSPPA